MTERPDRSAEALGHTSTITGTAGRRGRAGLLTAGRPRHARVAAFRLLDARGGLVGLRAAVALLDDRDEKLRTWAGQSVQRWRPGADTPPGEAEVGELLDRARHLFGGHVLRRRTWEAGLSGRHGFGW